MHFRGISTPFTTVGWDQNFDRDQGRDQKYDGTGTGTKDHDQVWSGTGTGAGTGTGTMTKKVTRISNKKKSIKIALIIFLNLQ